MLNTAFEERSVSEHAPRRRAFLPLVLAASALVCLLAVARAAAADDAGTLVDAAADGADLDGGSAEPSGDAAADATTGTPDDDAATGAQADASVDAAAGDDASVAADGSDAASADAAADAGAVAPLVTGVALTFPRGTGNDSYGCSCQSIGGTGGPGAEVIAAPLLAFLWMARRRRR
jgi:MYXO-CTERM domain-containing protein